MNYGYDNFTQSAYNLHIRQCLINGNQLLTNYEMFWHTITKIPPLNFERESKLKYTIIQQLSKNWNAL